MTVIMDQVETNLLTLYRRKEKPCLLFFLLIFNTSVTFKWLYSQSTTQTQGSGNYFQLDSHDVGHLACNSCHTQNGLNGAAGRIVTFNYTTNTSFSTSSLKFNNRYILILC